ncbi:hypothetical protein GCM10010156_63400 [Planobispora rosea]|uniref:Uncharacterized protein n=1 Tax=Planobispora rosea TaxID=35762 RepID=A0A8J3S9P8_PLARO|nr:hypothetical protein [Planobispora rosea]GGS96534.1 hypothetical protein GCM10010156_63400 [Planobispora rosea]GIH87639.1 hypothetical protein Pro02_60470 [Planobispora rosea]
MFHVYEFDDTTRTYVPMGIERERLKLVRPFPIDIPLKRLIV